jgi:RND family efflux transporter MFP subunit
MMKSTTRNLAILLTLALLLSGGAGCSRELPATSVAPETVRDIDTQLVQRASMPSYYEAMGTIRPLQSAQVAAQVMGNIVRINVREGDRVSKGQLLGVIDDSQTRSSLDRATAGQNAAQQEIAAADAEFTLAESTLNRYQDLFDKKSVSPHEFDEVKTRYEAAKARREMVRAARAGAEAAVSQARASQSFTQLRAPFSGVVTAKLAEAGNLASPGTPIFVIEDTSSFRLETAVDESGLSFIHLGEVVPVAVDALGVTQLTGKVVQVLPTADSASRTFLVKIELPKNATIRSGLFGRARFPSGTREGLAVPQTALVERGGMQAVYVLGTDQVASLRYVAPGRIDGKGIEILSGLDGGERIVVAPGAHELNGKKIEVR